MSTKKNNVKKAYATGLFTVSAAGFTIGVITLSFLSYRQQCESSIEQVDQSLLVMRHIGTVIFIHIIAFPLVVSYNWSRIRTTKRMAELDNLLQHDYEKLKARETELQDAIRDLERFNNLAIGREGRIIELKAEVNTLLQQMDRPKRYNVDRLE